MTAKEKLEALTNSWYGFAVFGALASFLGGGIGFFSIISAFIGLVFSILVTWWLGRRLLKRSSLTRFVLVIVSALSAVFGVLGIAKMSWVFITSWELSLLGAIGFACVTVWMNARSFRVLTDAQVKAYIAS